MNQAITLSALIMAAGLATAGGVGTVDHDPLAAPQRERTDQVRDLFMRQVPFKSQPSNDEILRATLSKHDAVLKNN